MHVRWNPRHGLTLTAIYIHNVDFMFDVNIYCDCYCCVRASCVSMWECMDSCDWVVDKEYTQRNARNINTPTTGIFQTDTRTPYTHAKWANERKSEGMKDVWEEIWFPVNEGELPISFKYFHRALQAMWMCEFGKGDVTFNCGIVCEQNRHSVDRNVGRSPFATAKTLDKEWQHEYKKHERINNRTEKTTTADDDDDDDVFTGELVMY